MVEDLQSDGRLPDAASTDEGNRVQAFCKTNDTFDELVASETGSWRRGRLLSGRAKYEHKLLGPLKTGIR